MKLTTKKLVQIIREEVENTFAEAERGDFGNPKRQRRYGSTDIGDIYVSPVDGGSLISLEEILGELDAQDLDISKTRLGWHAVVYNGSEEELREQMAQDAALAALLEDCITPDRELPKDGEAQHLERYTHSGIGAVKKTA